MKLLRKICLLVVLFSFALLVGCTTIKEGVVAKKMYTPAYSGYEYTNAYGMGIDGKYDMEFKYKLVHHSAEYKIVLKDCVDSEGKKYESFTVSVTQSTYNKYEVGDTYKEG
jgi:hypothetical protein